MKKAIHDIAAQILAEKQKPMTADEIFEAITSQGLYEFKAKSPKSVLRSQLRRHSANLSGAHQAAQKIFKMSPDGQFTLA